MQTQDDPNAGNGTEQTPPKKTFLNQLPVWLSSKVSIYIYIFLFLYLVVFAFIGMVVPQLYSLVPGDNIQLILGNYTNVLSALGASIAAGAGVAVHHSIRRLHDRHDRLEKAIGELHAKLDRLEAAERERAGSGGEK